MKKTLLILIAVAIVETVAASSAHAVYCYCQNVYDVMNHQWVCVPVCQ